MKKKICLKQKYWGYCFKCDKQDKHIISQDEITDEHWALGKKN
ncbi:hypothetical protein [Spiroplasma phoeniceum]|nr:hypothetical protein [Spiroplasma phoeniceum]